MLELSCTARRIGDYDSRTEEYEVSYSVEDASPRSLEIKYQAARAYEINAALDAAVEDRPRGYRGVRPRARRQADRRGALQV